MIVTETYLENAKRLKQMFKNNFGLSEESCNRLCSYVDDPTIMLNDKSKYLLEKYGDKVIDYRIPIEIEKLYKKEDISEIYVILESLNEILYEEFPEYRTVENGCNISCDLLLENKFILFGQTRKLWKFLKSRSLKIATDLLKKNKSVSLSRLLTKYCIGSMVYYINKYKDDCGTRNTQLSEKIKKYQDDYKEEYRFINETALAEAINRTFEIISDIIGAKNIPNPYGYNAYLSFNFFDWLLASTGEGWSSCISLHSEMLYSIGLIGTMACPDWGMLLISKKEEKNEFGIKVPHIVTRSWVIYGSNEKYNIVNWYPHSISGNVKENKTFLNGDLQFEVIKEQTDVKGDSWFKPVYLKNGTCPFIYADCYGITLSKSHNSVKMDLNGDKCGIINISCHNEQYSREGCFDSMCERIKRCYDSLAEIIDNNKDIIDVYDNADAQAGDYYCDCCEEYCEEVTEVIGYGFVCNDCLDNDRFYYCEICHSYHDTYNMDMQFVEDMTVCEDCLNANFIYCDRCSEYHRTSIEVVGTSDHFCEDCIDEMIKNEEIFFCESCEQYHLEKRKNLVGKDGAEKAICDNCLNQFNYCSKHEEFYKKTIVGGCPSCADENKKNSLSEERIS